MADIILRDRGVIIDGVYLALHGDMLEIKSEENKDSSRDVNHQRFALHHNADDELEVNKSNKYARVIINSKERPLIIRGDVQILGDLEVSGSTNRSPYIRDDIYNRIREEILIDIKFDLMNNLSDKIPELRNNKDWANELKTLKEILNNKRKK